MFNERFVKNWLCETAYSKLLSGWHCDTGTQSSSQLCMAQLHEATSVSMQCYGRRESHIETVISTCQPMVTYGLKILHRQRRRKRCETANLKGGVGCEYSEERQEMMAVRLRKGKGSKLVIMGSEIVIIHTDRLQCHSSRASSQPK